MKGSNLELASQLEDMATLIAEKTNDCLASIHIDAAGLIRLGETNDDRLENLISSFYEQNFWVGIL